MFLLLRPWLSVGWGGGVLFWIFFGKVSEAFENTNTIHLVETVPLPVVFLSVEDLLHETVA